MHMFISSAVDVKQGNIFGATMLGWTVKTLGVRTRFGPPTPNCGLKSADKDFCVLYKHSEIMRAHNIFCYASWQCAF